MTITEQPSTSAKWDPTDHPSGRDPFLAASESSKAPSTQSFPSVALWGLVLYRPALVNVPCRCAVAKWQGGTESKLQSSNRGLDVAHRGLDAADRGFG